MKVGEEAEVGHVIVDDESLLALGTITAKAQKILMSNSSENLDLHRELHLGFRAPHFQPFDSNLKAPPCPRQHSWSVKFLKSARLPPLEAHVSQ